MSTTKKIIITLIVVLVLGFILSPFSKYVLSLGVMSVYSKMEEDESIMAEKKIDINMPGGDSTAEADWYPFVMTFNSFDDFGNYIGNDNLKLTILYNFPAFDLWKGCSKIFDPASPYYSGFYGAYLVCQKTGTAGDDGKMYGFLPDGTVNSEEIGEIPKYDLQRLVLQDFGLEPQDATFQWEVTEVSYGEKVAGTEGWAKVDAKIKMNGLSHRKRDDVRSYIQYGAPNFPENKDTDAEWEFAPVEMVGRVYCKYLDREDTCVFLYVLAKTEMVLEKTDKDMLQNTVLQVAS